MSIFDTPPILPRIEKELAEPASQVAPKGWLGALFARHSIDIESSSECLNQSAYYKCNRWDLPQQDDGEDQYNDDKGDLDRWKKFNDRVQHRFMDIFNDIIHYFGFGDARRALATDTTDDEVDDICFDYDDTWYAPDYSTRPDLVILGQDAKQLPRSTDSYRASMSTEEEQRRELYRGCVSVGKLERCQLRGDSDRKLEKVATCARECFKQQPNRRFLYFFSLTVDVFQLFYFDRGGAVQSETVDIHEDALTFIQLVRFLANPDLSTLGFDSKVYWDRDERHIEIQSSDRVIKYNVESVLFQQPAIFGFGTTCWIAREVGTRKRVVVKDQWNREDCDTEADLLITAKEAAIPGVACLLAVDQTFAKHPLTTSSLRQSQCLDTPAQNDRKFSRIVRELCGPSIRNFKSGLQLLQALRDSIETHYHLVKAGILHRDISADNIRLGPASGRRGILLNLAQGTRCERGRPAPEDDVLIGTYMFRSAMNIVGASRKTLQGRQRHDFIDDLESFFWVYAWIMTVQNGPGLKNLVPETEKSDRTLDWEADATPQAHLWKRCYLGNEYHPEFDYITAYFSKPVYLKLFDDLRSLLHSYFDRKSGRPKGANADWPEIDCFDEIEEIYAKVLGCFDVAIKALSPTPKLPSRTQPIRQVKLAKRGREEAHPPSLRKVKRARLDQPVRQPKRQRDEDLASSALPEPKKVRVDPRHVVLPPADAPQKVTGSVPFNLRRSSRLKTGR